MKHDLTPFKATFSDFPFAMSYIVGQYYLKMHACYTIVFFSASSCGTELPDHTETLRYKLRKAQYIKKNIYTTNTY